MRIMKNVAKRLLALAMAWAMVLSLLPAIPLGVHVHAADNTSGTLQGLVDGLGASYEKNYDKNTCSVQGNNGITIQVYTEQGKEKDDCGKDKDAWWGRSVTLTLQNNMTVAATLSFAMGSVFGADPSAANLKPTFGGDKTPTLVDGKYTVKLEVGQKTTITLTTASDKTAFGYSPYSLSLTDISLVAEGATYTVAFKYASDAKGSYTVGGQTVVTAGRTDTNVPGNTKYELQAAATSGDYVFSHWIVTRGGAEGVATGNPYTLEITADTEVYPVYVSKDSAQFKVGDKTFYDLNAADAYAKISTDKIIVLVGDGTLPAGDYVISAGNTLLIPFDNAGTCYTDKDEKYNENSPATPYVFRTLTMSDGATINVEGGGAINVGAQHSPATGGKPYGGRVYGPYGLIKMQGNSAINLKSGAVLYAWGYVTGTGTVTAKSGATIHEIMQITDFAGGTATGAMTGQNIDTKIFPFSQYYVQNVEVLEILESGAQLATTTSITGLSTTASSNVAFIGEGGMFTMAEGAVVTKKYDSATDRLIITANGDVALGGLTAGAAGITIESEKYYLPINGNITIDIQSGKATMNQDILLLPGAKISVGKDATVVVPSGRKVFAYDSADWKNCVFAENSFTTHKGLTYLPATDKASTRTLGGDVEIDINGTLEVSGSVYTSAGGAKVISSQKTGKIVLKAAAPSSTTIKALKSQNSNSAAALDKWGLTSSTKSNATFYDVPMNPAVLTNADGTTVSTAGAAANSTFYYNVDCDSWVKNVQSGHSPAADDGDCTTAICCSVCGAVTTAAKTHTDGDDADHKCDNAGCNVDNLTAHAFGEEWKSDGTNHWHECVCGAKSEVAAHSDSTDPDHNCDICGRENIEGHTPAADDGDCTTEVICTECGDVVVAAKTHTDGSDADHKCDNDGCNVDNITGHEYSDTWSYDATNHWHECACGDKKDTAGHVDADMNHKCDVCDYTTSTCEDADLDHKCDYGCGKDYGTCEDKDFDHDCDYGCDKVYGTCEDKDLDHDCDYGCDKVYGTCEDTDLDHKCDYGCGKDYGTCEDKDFEDRKSVV